jgi:hypothetical protein
MEGCIVRLQPALHGETSGGSMAQYSRSAGNDVKRALERPKKGTLR